VNHSPNPRVDAPPFRLLHGIKGEESCLQVLPINPLESGPSPHVQVIAHTDQSLGRPHISPKRHRALPQRLYL
jgi:hypothetical protein